MATAEVQVSYITADELAAMLRGPDAAGTRVVDVRDDDFEGGHIKGCVNITSDRFYQDAEADAIVAQLRGAKRVVFHCMFSQQRGPFCAGRFAARLQAGAGSGAAVPQVLVLSGGWRGFRRAYGDVEELTEGVQQW